MYEAAIDHIDQQKIVDLAMVYFNGIFVETSHPIKESSSTTKEEEGDPITHLVEKSYVIPQDYSKALQFFRKAADHDSYEALSYMGDIYWNGFGIAPDHRKAIQRHQHSANLRIGQSNYNKGLEYYQTKTTFPVAMVYLSKACDQEIYLATRYVGDMYRHGQGVDKNFSKAMTFYKKPSDQDGEFDFEVGMEYYEGKNDVEIEYLIAMTYFEKAAKKGHLKAGEKLYLLYNSGYDIGIDESDIKKYMELASYYQTWGTYVTTPNENHQANERESTQQDGRKNLETGKKYYDEDNFSLAFEYFKKASEQGEFIAQRHMADMYYYGQGVTKNDRLAREHYMNVADQQYGYANYTFGHQYYCGQHVKQNYFAALIYFRKAGEQGNSLALKYMGEMYRHGHGVDANIEMALMYHQASANYQNGDNNVITGLEYYEGKGVDKDYSIALLYFKKSAEQKDADGCTYLAKMYFYGHGVKEDHATSTGYIEKAKAYDTTNQEGEQRESIKDWFDYEANASKPIEWHEEFSLYPASYDILAIGLNYYKDKHKEKSNTLALFYIQKASKKGDISAQKYMAQIYRDGSITEKDDKQAETVYHNIAEQQDASTNYATGVQYYNGDGVVMNHFTAFVFFRNAAEQNHLQSLRYVADMYCSGKGVTKNIEKSIEYHKKISKHQTMAENYKTGVKYYDNHALEYNHLIATIYLKNAVEQKCSESAVLLGDMYYKGLGVDKDYGTAYFYFQWAFNHGNPKGEQRMIDYDFHDQELNRDQVLEWNRKFASLQSKEENFSLGLKFFEGKQIEQDYEVAFIYFKKAAEEDHYDAQRYIGDIYYHGYGIEKNQEASSSYYNRAANLQYGYYNYILGLNYCDGKYTDQNHCAAFIFMKKAAEQGNILAFKYLGDFYNYGYGTDSDETKALECHRINASNLDSEENCKLGMEYYYGKGVRQCHTISIVYFQESVDQGNDEGHMYLIDMYMNGYGIDKDASVASTFVKKIIDKNIRKNNQLREFSNYTYAHVNGSSTDTLGFHKHIALQQNISDNFSTGLKYYYGNLINQNDSLAFLYFSKALEQGGYRAQPFLNDLYQKGYSTLDDIIELKDAKDKPQEGYEDYVFGMKLYNGEFFKPKNYYGAFEYLTKSAQQGYMKANLTLGHMYYHGYGTQKNIKKAAECYVLASTLGLDVPSIAVAEGFHCSQKFSSCFNWYQKIDSSDIKYSYALRGIGLLYEYGDGVSLSYQSAFEKYHLSSEKGNKGGHLNLGLLYYFGKGVKQNYDTAYNYFIEVIKGEYKDGNTYVIVKQLETGNTIVSRSSKRTYQHEKESYIYGLAYSYIGNIHKYGWSTYSDNKKAEECFVKAIELGILEAVKERSSVSSF